MSKGARAYICCSLLRAKENALLRMYFAGIDLFEFLVLIIISLNALPIYDKVSGFFHCLLETAELEIFSGIFWIFFWDHWKLLKNHGDHVYGNHNGHPTTLLYPFTRDEQ